jgi:MscS family membrane protein
MPIFANHQTKTFMFRFQNVLLLCLLFWAPFLSAQDVTVVAAAPEQWVVDDNGDTLYFSLNTPRNTLVTHLKYLQPETFRPEISAETFNLQDKEKAQVLAIKLKQILDANGLFVDTDEIPNTPDYTDSLTRLNRLVLFSNYPQIMLERVNGKWYYSKRTVEAIPALHREKFPFGSDFLMNLFPASIAHKEVLGLHMWQYLGILLIIVLSFILHRIQTFLIEVLIKLVSRKYANIDAQVELIHKIAKPMSMILVTLTLSFFVPVLQLPITFAHYIILLLNILTPMFATIGFYQAVDLLAFYMQRAASKTDTTLDDQLVPLVRRALKVFVVLIGFLIILQNLNFNVTALLAGISIGGLALALAAQDTIKNLFGSVMIFVDRPFQIGDWINFDGKDGTVEEVGFRSTRVRTFANSVISVPNGRIADMTVDNLGLRTYRRFTTNITITYDTPPVLITVFVDGLRELVEQHPDTRKDYFHVYVNNLNSHSIDILFYIFFSVPGWPEELKARHEIILQIVELAETLGVQFAFPTQTLHIQDFPEKQSLGPKYDTDPERMRAKVAAYLGKNIVAE